MTDDELNINKLCKEIYEYNYKTKTTLIHKYYYNDFNALTTVVEDYLDIDVSKTKYFYDNNGYLNEIQYFKDATNPSKLTSHQIIEYE